jgi:hypothetical protein
MTTMRKLRVSWANIVVLGVAAFGCASAPYSAARAPMGGDRLPPDVVHQRGFLDGIGGMKLHEQCWNPSSPSRAVVVLVHDLKDHYPLRAVTRVATGKETDPCTPS